MSRFPLLGPYEVTNPITQRVYGEIERELGFGIVPNVFRAMASNPPFLEANWNAFRGTVLQGSLPRLLKEMIGVVVSAVHGSEYARLVHLHSLGVQGVGEDVLRALSAGSVEAERLSPATTAALRFAKHAAEEPAQLTDPDFASLSEAGLSQADVFEVIATIQLFTAVNLFTDLANVEVDQV